ncbi:MAG: DegV family EDD domain-containing protein [Lachnospiraceae bacterium]|nr:DegV family EDD domain-containing protein [Lachnospiraceae bacterium]
MKKFFGYIFHPGRIPHFEKLKEQGVRDSLKISLIVNPLVLFAVILFYAMSVIWPESYGEAELLAKYRMVYLIVMGGFFVYEIILLYINKHIEDHIRKLPAINVFAVILMLGWGIRMTMLDTLVFGRVDVTLYMVVAFCIPFCIYLDARAFLVLAVLADSIVVALFLQDGVDAAFNKSNLVDFIVFIVIHIVLGLIAMYFKYVMREQILEQEYQKEEIRQLGMAQSRFFSNMSHEIRTPINTIIGLNEMILREDASDEINEDAQNIQAAGKMLLNLINDILDMSKFESGQMELNMASYHTADMLSDIVGMLWVKAKEKGLEFRVDISEELPAELSGDEMRIKQILINVLNNAIKYTERGYVELAIRCKKDDAGNAVVAYSVSDTGVGIKKESMPHLFSAFKRVDEDKNRYIEGTGLGLSIVKQLVELMGGKITVNSIYTKGSTFVIEIPQRIVNEDTIGEINLDKKSNARRGYHYVEAFEAPQAKVLVVDDTPANLLVVRKLLRGTKVQITTVESGAEALKNTVEETYHLILMDHKMPGMDGIECLHEIRNQTGGLNHETKIVALTANGGSEMEEMYAREGFDGYLMKPVTGRDLETILYRFLPKDLVSMTGTDSQLAKESIAWISGHKKKVAVKITTESVADIPDELLAKYDIAVLPHLVRTSGGVFKDGLEIETNGLLTYMKDLSAKVDAVPPAVADHENFFSQQLDHASSIIHVSISKQLNNSGCPIAIEAAENFGNVTVVDSGQLSSGQGLMAIEAARLAAKGKSMEQIAGKLEMMRGHIHTSFIVDTLDFLVRQGQIGSRIGRLAQAFMVHPVLKLKKGEMQVDRVYFGAREKAWKRYIDSVFNVSGEIDRRMLFVTYVGMTTRELEQVRKMAESKLAFDEVYFQKAAPVIASNCGPGTFGLLFFTKYDDEEKL